MNLALGIFFALLLLVMLGGIGWTLEREPKLPPAWLGLPLLVLYVCGMFGSFACACMFITYGVDG